MNSQEGRGIRGCDTGLMFNGFGFEAQRNSCAVPLSALDLDPTLGGGRARTERRERRKRRKRRKGRRGRGLEMVQRGVGLGKGEGEGGVDGRGGWEGWWWWW